MMKSLINLCFIRKGTNPEEIPTTRRKMVSMSLRILETLPREIPPKSDVFLEKKSLIR